MDLFKFYDKLVIATDKPFFHPKNADIFLISPRKHVVGTHYKRLTEVLLMSTHNICFRGEIRKILCGYPLLSVAIVSVRIIADPGAAKSSPTSAT